MGIHVDKVVSPPTQGRKEIRSIIDDWFDNERLRCGSINYILYSSIVRGFISEMPAPIAYLNWATRAIFLDATRAIPAAFHFNYETISP
jgi:hypothetical protein